MCTANAKKNDDDSSSGASAGGVAGIVIAVAFLAAGGGYALYNYRMKQMTATKGDQYAKLDGKLLTDRDAV